LTSNTVAAHIHCCLPSPLAPMNVGVATTVPAFIGFPLGVTSGNYSSQVFDLTQPLIYNPAFVTLQGGLPQAEAALIAGIMNSETLLQHPHRYVRGRRDPRVSDTCARGRDPLIARPGNQRSDRSEKAPDGEPTEILGASFTF
jgi:hypothetical protein